MSAKDSIATQTCELFKEKFNDFLTIYPIPSKYRIILPKSNQTVFDAPPGYVGLYTHSFSLANLRLSLTELFYEVLEYFQVHISRLNPFSCAKLTTSVVMCKVYGCEPSVDLFQGFFNLFQVEIAFKNCIYTEDDEDLAFLPKEPSSGFGIADSGGSPKPELFVVPPESVAARIKDRKCKTKGGSSRPPVKRKLAFGSSTSRATRAKTSSSNDDAPFLTVFDDDEGLPDVLELKDGTAYHLKIFTITPPA
ncbi:hypothetical protein Tco_0767802 [Tanacetum coccineum]